MAMLELFERGVQLAFERLGYTSAKDLGDFVGGHLPEAHLAGALDFYE